MTLFLGLSGAEEDIIAALKIAHQDLVVKDETGKDVLGSVYTDDIALHYDNYTPAGKFVMVWFLKNQNLNTLGANLTRKWESGGAPMKWAGT